MPFLTQGKTSWKFLLIVFVLAVIVGGGIWWICADRTEKTPTNICGPEGLDYWISIQNCNKSCITDNDCKYTCGCGAINKNEICHDEDITYDCVDHEVECKDGICIVGEEIIKDETADWQTYRNEEYGFEVKYPKEFEEYPLCRLSENKVGGYEGAHFPARTIVNLGNITIDSSQSEYMYLQTLSNRVNSFIYNNKEQWGTGWTTERQDINIDGEKAIKVKVELGIDNLLSPQEGGNVDFFEKVYLWNDLLETGYIFSLLGKPSCSSELAKKGIAEVDIFNQILSTFRFLDVSNSIEEVDFLTYLMNKYCGENCNISEYCVANPHQEPITIDFIKYADLDGDGNKEALITAYTCRAPQAYPDINSVYKLQSNGEFNELEINNDFQGKSVFDENNRRTNGLDIQDGKLVNTIPIYNKDDGFCCPSGGIKEIFYEWNENESKFIVADVIIKK